MKKPRKRLTIGLSVGGALLAVILAVALIFVFGLKIGSKGGDVSIPLGNIGVVYDDQYTYFGEKTNETKGLDQTAYAEGPVSSDITPLYAAVAEEAITEHGVIEFQETQFDCKARGVFKMDLLDFNQDGTDELLMMYSNESDSVFPVIEVWTVKNGEATLVFSGRSRVESQEPIFGFNLYQNAGNLYVPVYDSLDCNPVYVHLYGFDNDGEFGEIYQYENNEFYMNQLPDGMEFTDYDNIPFYIDSLRDDFEGDKNAMKEKLQTDMADILNKLGIAAVKNGEMENSASPNVSLSAFTGEWVCNSETADMSAYLYLDDGEDGSLVCSLSFYRLSGDSGYITLDNGNKGSLLSESGKFDAEVEFNPESESILVRFPEDTRVYDDTTVAFYFGTQDLYFTRPG